MANFCGSCGTQVQAEQKFCPKCGRALTGGAARAEPVGQRPDAAGKRPGIATVIIFLVLIVGGMATFALMRTRSNRQAEAPAAIDLSTQPGSKFEVTYQPQTVVIDPATTEKSFEGASPDGALLVFNTSVPAIRGLRAGSVLLLQGLAVEKSSGRRRSR